MLDVEKFVAGLHTYIERALSPIVERLDALEARAPEKGEKGDKGEPGADAHPISIEDITPLIEQAVKEFPTPQDGKDGRDGVDGQDGADGQDGKSVTLDDVRPMLEAELAKWALDFERRAQDTLQRAIDRMPTPKDGKDGASGRDAFQLEDVELSIADDDRTLTLAFVRDGTRAERSIRLNHPIYRGIWKDGAYEKGDCVTWGGSAFIATRDTGSKPETDDSWKLCVKRGRDGKDGARGEKGERGERGPKGETPVELKTGKIR